MITRRALSLAFCLRQGGRFIEPVPRQRFFQIPSRSLITLPKKEHRFRAAVLLLGPIITFGLGVWQVKRLFWKRELIEHLESTAKAKPVSLDVLKEGENLDQLSERLPEYRRVKVCGRFDHSREIYIRPRPMVDRKGKPTDQYGAFVVTPFILSSSIYPKNVRGTWILVNRGWVDYAHMDPTTRPEGQVNSEVELVGIVRKSEEKISPFVQKGISDEKNILWSQRNIEKIAEVLGTAKLYIDADLDSTIPGGPLGGQTILSVRNQHLSYIFTWWTLSAATGYIWFRTFCRP